MRTSGIHWSTATGEAAWVRERLDDFASDTAASVVPRGFEAYARLPHPLSADDVEGVEGEGSEAEWPDVHWARVAEWSGMPLERESRFPDIALPPHTPEGPRPWDGNGPEEGSLTGPALHALLEVLRRHTPDPERCWFCVWDGYGWDGAATFSFSALDTGDGEGDGGGEGSGRAVVPPQPSDPVPASVRSGPRVSLPHREYFLWHGDLSAALAFVDSEGQSPNLWWAGDRSWCVASEIDLTWTYVGGSRALIDELLADPRVEALPAGPDDAVQDRVPEWLGPRIAAAVDELLEHGRTVMEMSRGTVTARLRRPARLRAGSLRLAWESDAGSSASGGEELRRGSTGEALRRELADALGRTLLELANG
ncbi:hypothetical protein [Streptomyces sp. ODS28]|uniref:hypothetical protein n=1 Tax=Streptomyces sp. ODS28 TaxID=3136688 RepID=UPI0031EA7AC8